MPLSLERSHFHPEFNKTTRAFFYLSPCTCSTSLPLSTHFTLNRSDATKGLVSISKNPPKHTHTHTHIERLCRAPTRKCISSNPQDHLHIQSSAPQLMGIWLCEWQVAQSKKRGPSTHAILHPITLYHLHFHWNILQCTWHAWIMKAGGVLGNMLLYLQFSAPVMKSAQKLCHC